MIGNAIDAVWCAMKIGEFYSPSDLASTSGQSRVSVLRVLEFLKKYGFTEQLTKRELIFRRRWDSPSPADALHVLQTLNKNPRMSTVERTAGFLGR